MFMKNSLPREQGIIKLVILFIAVVAIISYFNINIDALLDSRAFQWSIGLLKALWQNYIAPAIDFIFSYLERN